ncbi:MAG: cytochrome c maturation protein CcmE [Nitrospinae bacterium]|nr:cytochrome c maturation protein CcmE [Nitrospinota bacterium]MBF0635504.1 cytochrome c maturation protein CcmE [Nitrospinota bacterium]
MDTAESSQAAPAVVGVGGGPRKASGNSAQKKFLVGSAIIVGAIAYLIYTGVQASGSYYRTVSEVVAMGSAASNMSLRLEGKVSPGTIEKDTANLKLNFQITDKSNKSIPVYYEGVVPDMFHDNIDVVVEGKLGQDGKFVATKLLTSCPSRYDAAKEMKKPS